VSANDPAPSSAALLPADAVVLHIGPQKTGTTAIQGAMHAGRDRLAEHNIRYAGDGPHPREAVAAGVGKRERSGLRPSPKEWKALVAEVAAASSQRVIVSSETFADADDEAIASSVAALGGDRAHVVITVRPVVSMLPSAWQQYVRNGLVEAYDDWLHGVLDDPENARSTPSFWRRHRTYDLVEHWASVVGIERITVVAPDPADPLALLHGFESLLDLPTGTLELQSDRSNRSLTYGEIELVRALNQEFHDRGWYDAHYNRLIRRGAVDRMRLSHTPSATEAPITTPQWAVTAAAAIGGSVGERLRQTGVRVIGSLDNLAAPPKSTALIRPDDAELGAPLLASDAAAHAVMGAILRGDLATSPGKGKRKPGAKPTAAAKKGAGPASEAKAGEPAPRRAKRRGRLSR
jgi:hypothetical protein